MFPYVVAALACLLFFYNPLLEYVYGPGEYRQQQQRQGRIIPRTPRPRINESLLAIDDDDDDDAASAAADCPPDAYVVHILSKAPLVLYVENFLSEDERAHLLEIRCGFFYFKSSLRSSSSSSSSYPVVRFVRVSRASWMGG